MNTTHPYTPPKRGFYTESPLGRGLGVGANATIIPSLIDYNISYPIEFSEEPLSQINLNLFILVVSAAFFAMNQSQYTQG
jgi:hypothetical protein